jgi:hypothetical protein
MSKQKSASPRLKGAGSTNRTYSVDSAWRDIKGNKVRIGNITYFAPVDPYKIKERKEFRNATKNPYVYRATKIQTTFTVSDGYTTYVVPRSEEELPGEQREQFEKGTKLKIPYWDNQEFTVEQIKDWVDKQVKDMDLQSNIFNGEQLAIEQGRCVLAILPIDKEEDKWIMPEQIRLIRPELTMRPLIDDDTGDFKGVQCTGAKSKQFGNLIPAERCIYITHGFNNELYSDFYGDSKVSRIADIANNLNVILVNDYGNAARRTWRRPSIYGVPIPPQEYGNEETILGKFATDINKNDGEDLAVTGASNKDEVGVQLLSQGGDHGDIGGLEVIRMGLVKSIVTEFGVPGFLLSEADFGPLGGNANLAEVDGYLNTEIKQEKTALEKIVETQLYDRILMILFAVESADELPIKMIHKFNKPKLWTLLTGESLDVLERMMMDGLIDEDGVRDFIGLDELDKETMTTGSDISPGTSRAQSWNRPVTNVNIWGGQTNVDVPTMPKGWGKNSVPTRWTPKLGNKGTLWGGKRR